MHTCLHYANEMCMFIGEGKQCSFVSDAMKFTFLKISPETGC